ncbi:WW domain-containing oxidoreductase [Bimuria novae-zelandiae CBS 107.79]|uniref:WW domain-containing oxidoreductase n=1 Tax=Bimuria novae-zelandiae CBS 107.79 TaxID=1447943 RepID=A0A6A5UNK3_9PLEO|nr:WW domain-containing oxidoreductase [Bimuria novae-zelandiae CBS 107.79]
MGSNKPLPYGRYTPGSTIAADNAAHITGKTILTTGVSPSGTGALFVETLAAHSPALLILAGRSPSKLAATASKIASINASVKTRLLDLDLASLPSVRRAAAEMLSWTDVGRIDVLMNNAGIMAGPYRKSEDGVELQFAANHLGHFLLTNLLMPLLLASPSPCVVNISSDGHRLGGIRFSDPSFSNGSEYNQWVAYGQSKTANILFARALAAKLGGKGLRAYSVHPGVLMSTNLVAAGGLGERDFAELKKLDKSLGEPLGEDDAVFDFKNEDEMVATHVTAAFDPRLDEERWNGCYLEDGNVSEGVRACARGEGDEERLWKLSEELVGERFEY